MSGSAPMSMLAMLRKTCLVSLVILAGLVVPSGATAFAEPLASVPSPSPSPAFAPPWAHTALDADAPDPDVVRFGNTYYAYTTGTTWGNHIGILTSASPTSGWRTLTNGATGSSAFPSIPAGASIQSWQANNTQHAPGVFFWGGQYVMYYAAQTVSGHGGHYCLSVATSSSPSGPFADRSNGPWLCMDAQGGAIDPSPYVDSSGKAWLYFKTYDDINQSTQPSQIFAVPLSADGLGYGAPVSVLNQNTLSSPFETVENPQMVGGNGTYVMLFSRGQWNSSSYRMGYASCSGPTGPCTEGQPNTILSSYANVRGPGGGTAFDDGSGGWYLGYQGWQGAAGCTTYSGTSCARQLFVSPMQLNAGQFGPGNCRADTTPKAFPDPNSTRGYWMLGADGGVFTFGSSTFYGSLPGLHIQDQSLAINSTRSGNGYWVLGKDGGVFSFGDASYRGSVPGLHLGTPVEVVDMKRTPSGNGYWVLGKDGGIFAFGDAQYFGSVPGLHLPTGVTVKKLAPTADGRGYWVLGSDGGIFSFGDAVFHGSVPGLHLGVPVTGQSIAADPQGRGYWVMGTDGGVFTFGVPYYGSVPGTGTCNPPFATQLTATSDGYYVTSWIGAMYSFGNAPFYGGFPHLTLATAAVDLTIKTS